LIRIVTVKLEELGNNKLCKQFQTPERELGMAFSELGEGDCSGDSL
jgi:hypothetical protein